jgi:ABC-type Fe3+-hydroxamate transport system substrate-binding protein
MRAVRTSCALGAAALVLGATACSGSSSPRAKPSAASTTRAADATTTVPHAVTLKLSWLRGQTVAVGRAPRANVAAAVTKVVRRYVELASVEPLERGGASAARLGALLSPALRARLKTADAGVLTDNGLGPVRSSTTERGAMRMITLVDAAGRSVAVAARLNTTVVADGPAGHLAVTRSGELLLMPAGLTWRIVGYDLTVVRRDTATGKATTTTAASGTTTP